MLKKKYIHDETGNTYIVDFNTYIDDGRISYTVKPPWGEYINHTTKAYYRSPKTWDDYLGNTHFGYYTRVPLGNGTTRRVYIFD